MNGIDPELIRKFWKRVIKTSNCWLWIGACRPDGYGHFWIGRNGIGNVRSHRFSFMLENGKITSGLNVCHKCDNPTCVRPGHLFEGTDYDNVQDCVRKGRHGHGTLGAPRGKLNGMHTHPESRPIGEKNHFSKLKEEQVRQIKRMLADKMSHSAIAAKFSVSRGLVSMISSGKRWACLK
jgi:hypothetical protein